MTQVAKFSFTGLIATALTPFKSDKTSSLNVSVVPDLAKYYSERGFGAILINGSYAEGMAMTTEERMEMATAWRHAIKNTHTKLMVHVGGTNLQDVKKLAEHAQSINAHAILCLPELFYKPSTVEELINYLKEIGDCAPRVPLFYYHAPAMGVNLDMAEFFEKVKHSIPSLGGIKFAGTNLDELTQAYRAAGDRYRIFVSNNYIIVPSMVIGIDTFMPPSVNVAPDLVRKLYFAAIKRDYRTAQMHQMKLVTIMNKLALMDKGIISAMKAITRRLLLPYKIDLGPTRRPLRNFDSLVNESKLAWLIVSESL